jgi:hypothetical protein
MSPRTLRSVAFTARAAFLARVALGGLGGLGGLSVSSSARADPPPVGAPAARGPAAATPSAEADARFRRGVELYREGDYRAALIEFRRAYAISPAYQVLYNIAEACYQLQDYAGSLKAFQQYEALGEARIPEARRAAVDAEIQRLGARVATLRVHATAPGVDIAIDDEKIGAAPLDRPIVVSAGRRQILASRRGEIKARRLIDIAGGDTVEVTLTIPDEIAAPKLSGPDRHPASDAPRGPIARPPSITTWVLPWAASAALTMGAAVTGGLALGASANLRSRLDAFPGDPTAITLARRATSALTLTSDLLTGAAALTTGAALYLTITRRRGRAPAVTLSLGPSGLEARGAF